MTTRQSTIWLSVKRLFDIAVAAGALTSLSPLIALIALGIKLDDRGPIFFIQDRVGKKRRNFRCCKFRTMVVDAEWIGNQHTVTADDERITRVGRWLRNWTLDEIPQLWNVLKGEMSIVGPRPWVPDQAAYCSQTDSRRFNFKPGMAGWAWIHGRNRLPWDERVRRKLERFLARIGLKPVEMQSARIPSYTHFTRSWQRAAGCEIYLVGDAAAQVKVTTVGGLVTGLRGAKAAAYAILRRSDYAKELRALKRELSLHLLIRSVLNRFQSRDYDRLLGLLNEQMIHLLGAHNRDHAARILCRLLWAQPRLLSLAGILSRRLWQGSARQNPHVQRYSVESELSRHPGIPAREDADSA